MLSRDKVLKSSIGQIQNLEDLKENKYQNRKLKKLCLPFYLKGIMPNN